MPFMQAMLEGKTIQHTDLDTGEWVDVDPSTVCQFTGLKDCEGREVWEGDIIQDVDYYYNKYVVILLKAHSLHERKVYIHVFLFMNV